MFLLEIASILRHAIIILIILMGFVCGIQKVVVELAVQLTCSRMNCLGSDSLGKRPETLKRC
jgi:hypothetical protein